MYILFDVGGSSTKVGIINDNEELINKYNLSSKKSLKSFISGLEKEIEKAIDEYKIEGIGISAPGTVDTKSGMINGMSALPYIHTENWAYKLQKKYKLPVAIDNDANCAALCEMHFAEVKEEKLAFFVIGSGVGGAIVNKGKIESSRRLEVGEFGYILLQRKDGKYRNLSQLGTLPNVRKRLERDLNIKETTYEILDKYFQGIDPYYQAVDEMFDYLCMGIYNIQYAVDPHVIYIGGGISQSEKFINELKNRLSKPPFDGANIELRPVTYYNDNNLLGAYVNLKTMINEGRKLCTQ